MARSRNPIQRKLWRRMEELGLEQWEVAGRADVKNQIAYDLLGSPDDNEIDAVWSLGEVKRVVDALGLNLTELLGMKCVFCEKGQEQWSELATLPRNEVISRRREELGLSKEDLLTKLGYTQWFAEHSGPDYAYREWAEGIMSKYTAMEERPDSIDRLVLGDVKHVAKGLRIPAQLLLGVKCPKCGR